MYEDNNWYGHRYILLRYLKKKDQPIFGQIQHGWFPAPPSSPWADKTKRFINSIIPTLIWSHNYGDKNPKLVKVGAPFLYLDNFLKIKKINKINKGTLFVPSHGKDVSELKNKSYNSAQMNNNIPPQYDYEEYIKKIQKRYNPPFEVCLHISDYKNKEIVELFTKKGWKVYCLVKKNDNRSLIKLRKFFLKKKIIIFTGFNTSALLYAMYLKKKINIMIPKNYTNHHLPVKYKKVLKKYKNLNYSYEFAKNELGYKYLKKRQDLERILLLNSFTRKIFAKIMSIYRRRKYNS